MNLLNDIEGTLVVANETAPTELVEALVQTIRAEQGFIRKRTLSGFAFDTGAAQVPGSPLRMVGSGLINVEPADQGVVIRYHLSLGRLRLVAGFMLALACGVGFLGALVSQHLLGCSLILPVAMVVPLFYLVNYSRIEHSFPIILKRAIRQG